MRCVLTGADCGCDIRTPFCTTHTAVTRQPEHVQVPQADPLAYLAAPVTTDRGLRYNEGKLRLDLLPPDTLEDLADLLTIGAKKYAERNWEKGMPYKDAIGSMLRHAWRWIGGEDDDPETGKSHMVHVMCNAMFLATWHRRKVGTDDRVSVFK